MESLNILELTDIQDRVFSLMGSARFNSLISELQLWVFSFTRSLWSQIKFIDGYIAIRKGSKMIISGVFWTAASQAVETNASYRIGAAEFDSEGNATWVSLYIPKPLYEAIGSENLTRRQVFVSGKASIKQGDTRAFINVRVDSLQLLAKAKAADIAEPVAAKKSTTRKSAPKKTVKQADVELDPFVD